MLGKMFGKKYTVETFKDLIQKKPPELEKIGKALDDNIDINHVDENGDTFLHYAIKNNLTTCAKFFIDKNIDLDVKDKEKKTPIYLTIEKENSSLAQAIIETNKININQLKDNRTLLQDAVLQGDKDVVNMLLKTNINKNHVDSHGRSVIFDAVSNGNENLINQILRIKDLDLNKVDEDKKTILHQKNIIEDDKLAMKLIKKGADPTIVDGQGKSYLLYIALRGMETEEVIDTVIESGFNINAPVRNKNSILMEIMFSFENLSSSEEHRRDDLMQMATKLVKKGLDVNALNIKGETVLFDAVRKLDIRSCAFLINEGIDINVINNEGNSVLSEIMYKGIQAMDVILLLLKHGADINIKNAKGQTLIEILNDLILYNHGNIPLPQDLIEKTEKNGQYLRLLREMLLNSSFDASCISSRGEPIFFKSLLTDNRPLFDLYCKFGININAVDKNGNSIFARYVDQIVHMKETPKDFRENLIMLINRKANVNMVDDKGKPILAKLISTNNMRMFRILFSVTKFDYAIQDKMGHTILYDCVVSSNLVAFKLIDQLVPKLKNIPDYMGIIPITYAALFGNIEMVLELMKLESNFTSGKTISAPVKAKFAPLVANLDNLTCGNPDELHKLEILKEQIRKDFS